MHPATKRLLTRHYCLVRMGQILNKVAVTLASTSPSHRNGHSRPRPCTAVPQPVVYWDFPQQHLRMSTRAICVAMVKEWCYTLRGGQLRVRRGWLELRYTSSRVIELHSWHYELTYIQVCAAQVARSLHCSTPLSSMKGARLEVETRDALFRHATASRYSYIWAQTTETRGSLNT